MEKSTSSDISGGPSRLMTWTYLQTLPLIFKIKVTLSGATTLLSFFYFLFLFSHLTFAQRNTASLFDKLSELLILVLKSAPDSLRSCPDSLCL